MSDLGVGQRAPISIQDFDQVAQHGLNVRVSEDGVKVYGNKSIFGRFVAWLKDDKQTNRTTREQFVRSLEQNYPDDVVGLRNRLLGEGVKFRPLSTRMVRQVLQEVKTEQARRDLSDKVPEQMTNARNTLLKSSGNVMVQGEMRQRDYRSDMKSLCNTLTDIKETLKRASPGVDDDLSDEIDNEIIKRLTENLDDSDDIGGSEVKRALDSLVNMAKHAPAGFDEGLFARLYDSLKDRAPDWGIRNPFY